MRSNAATFKLLLAHGGIFTDCDGGAAAVSRVGKWYNLFPGCKCARNVCSTNTDAIWRADWMHYSVLIFYVLIKCFNIKAYPRMRSIMGISLKIRYFVNWMIPPWFPLADADIIRYVVSITVFAIFALRPHCSLIMALLRVSIKTLQRDFCEREKKNRRGKGKEGEETLRIFGNIAQARGTKKKRAYQM